MKWGMRGQYRPVVTAFDVISISVLPEAICRVAAIASHCQFANGGVAPTGAGHLQELSVCSQHARNE